MWFKYPYTSYSELNLDWFLEQFKKLKEEWDTTSGEWDQMQLDFQTLEGTVQTFTTFVTQYFDNLDVQQEINNKLNQMALDGTLADLLAPLVDDKLPGVVDDKLGAVVTDQLPGVVTDQLPSVVEDQIGDAVAAPAATATTDWLTANVNPVGSAVTIDSSLTVAGSAADAKVVGDKFSDIEDSIEDIAPPVSETITSEFNQNNCTYIGNYIIDSEGDISANAQYYMYRFDMPYAGRWYMNNLGYSSYGICGVYHGEPSTSTFDSVIGRKKGTTTTDWNFNLSAGDVILVSVNLIDIISFRMFVEHSNTILPTLFMHDMKIAWFGDSISQLRKLPERTAEHIGCTVYNVSFAGAPLTHGNPTLYEGTSVMSLVSQIISGDFTDLNDALDAQEAQGIDVTQKRINAATLAGLNFNTDVTDIVIMAGTNDLQNDYAIPGSDMTGFKTNVQSIITSLNVNFPQIRIYFISDPYRGDITPATPDTKGHSLVDINDAISEVCNANDIPFFDLYSVCGINSNTQGYYLEADKLHQTEAGDIALAKINAKYLMSN